MPGSGASDHHEPGGTNRKPRGGGFDREILRRGVAQGKSPEQLSEELGTSSVRSVRNAMLRLSRKNHGKALATLPTGDVFSENERPCAEGASRTAIWLGVPLYATAEVFGLLESLATKGGWSSQLQWFKNTNGGELYIYGDTNMDGLKKGLMRNGFFLSLCTDKVIPRKELQEVSIKAIPSNPSVTLNEEEWEESLFEVDYSAHLEDLRVYLKDFIIGAKVRIIASDMNSRVWFDQEEMQCIGESMSKGGFYFMLRQDPLASVKHGHARIVFIHNDEMVLLDNMGNQELSDLYSKIIIEPNINYLGKGRYEVINTDKMFKKRTGYWVGYLPQKSRKEAIGLIKPLGPYLHSEYMAILGDYAREHGIQL